jgi:hypothetical protein
MFKEIFVVIHVNEQFSINLWNTIYDLPLIQYQNYIE